MNKYELTIVLDGKATAAKKKAAVEKIQKIITTFKGKVEKVDDWGKKELAYKIGKSDSGVFLLFSLELSGEGAKALPNKLKLEEEIIRYLLVKK
jgi:small subunit ribosomal protein S6